ncbi:hypothetical protein ACFQY4_15445 [Catellatospora bangladeshensis]|uniref:hypothetical protein n=1 Tax=Catellatospora bangladeshensis TaxID=310355 RepID=UPI00360EB767
MDEMLEVGQVSLTAAGTLGQDVGLEHAPRLPGTEADRAHQQPRVDRGEGEHLAETVVVQRHTADQAPDFGRQVADADVGLGIRLGQLVDHIVLCLLELVAGADPGQQLDRDDRVVGRLRRAQLAYREQGGQHDGDHRDEGGRDIDKVGNHDAERTEREQPAVSAGG